MYLKTGQVQLELSDKLGNATVNIRTTKFSGCFLSFSETDCVVFLGKTLYSHSASLHPGVSMGTNKPAME